MYFTLCSDKIPVAGKDQSAICDLERNRFTLIPNEIHDVLTYLDDHKIHDLVSSSRDPERVRSYFEFFEREELGFRTEWPDRFPRIPLEWDRPELILTAEIQVADRLEDYHLKGLDELERAQCKHVEITALDPLPFEELESLFSLFSGSGFRSMELLLPFETTHPIERTMELKKRTPEFKALVFYGTPKKILNTKDGIFWTPISLRELKARENPPFQDLIINKEFFLESQKHNPYYNRKASIDEEGNVKNAIEHKRNFGKIGEHSLQNIIKDEAFQELWFASNDKIEDVKDWELRYCWFNTHPLEKLDNGNYRIIWE